MRIFITKTDTDLKSLSATLLKSSSAASGTLDRVKALNPQVEDFQRLAAGTVLILPDAPDLKVSAGSPVGSGDLAGLASEVGAGLRAVGARTANRFETLASDHSAVKDAIKSAAAKRLVESDPTLAKRLKAVDAQFKVDQKAAAETKAQFDEVQKLALAEFEHLQKLLGQ